METQIRNLSDLHGYGIRNKAFHQETSDLSATDFSSSEGFINGGILYVFPVYGTARMGQEFAAQPKMNLGEVPQFLRRAARPKPLSWAS